MLLAARGTAGTAAAATAVSAADADADALFRTRSVAELRVIAAQVRASGRAWGSALFGGLMMFRWLLLLSALPPLFVLVLLRALLASCQLLLRPSVAAAVSDAAGPLTHAVPPPAALPVHQPPTLAAAAARAQARMGVERQHEELRLLVGSRYRELIDAADTVIAMRAAAERVVACVDGAGRLAVAARHAENGAAAVVGATIGGGGGDRAAATASNEAALFALASQMKLLADTPERMWAALETHDYLRAAQLCLLGAHVFAAVDGGGVGGAGAGATTTTTASATAAAAVAPPEASSDKRDRTIMAEQQASWSALRRQWLATGHIRERIVAGAQSLLADLRQPARTLTDALCAILLLRSADPGDLVDGAAATRALTAACDMALERAAQRHGAVEARAHLLQQLQQIATALERMAAVLGGDGDALLRRVANDVIAGAASDDDGHADVADERIGGAGAAAMHRPEHVGYLLSLYQGGVHMHAVMRHLPRTVLDFRPILPSSAVCVPRTALRAAAHAWLAASTSRLQPLIGELLQSVATVSDLASLVTSVERHFVQQQQSGSVPPPAHGDVHTGRRPSTPSWEPLVQELLGEPLRLCERLLRSATLERAQAIVVDACSRLRSTVQAHMDEALAAVGSGSLRAVSDDHDHDAASGALFADNRDETAADGASRTSRLPGTSFALRVLGCTDRRLASLLHAFNEAVGALAADVACMRPHRADAVAAEPAPAASAGPAPADWRVDGERLWLFLRHQLADTLRHGIHADLQTRRDGLAKQLDGCAEDSDACTALLDQHVLLARACLLLPTFPHHLRAVLGAPADDGARGAALAPRGRPHRPQPGPTDGTACLADVRPALVGLARAILDAWATHLARRHLRRLSAALHAENWTVPRAETDAWPGVAVAEPTESGPTVESIVRVPAHLSRPAAVAVAQLCDELARVGGHALPRGSLAALLAHVANGVAECYEHLLASRPPPASGSGPDACLSQDACIQLLFDVRVIADALSAQLGSQAAEFGRRAAHLLDRLRAGIDPFDMSVLERPLAERIARCRMSNALAWGPLLRLARSAPAGRAPLAPAQHGSEPQQQHARLVAPVAARFMLLPMARSSSKSASRAPHAGPRQ